MVSIEIILGELRRTRTYLEELDRETFFTGPLLPAKKHAPDGALYIRSNYATNHLFETKDESVVVLDRRWFEHASAFFTILYACTKASSSQSRAVVEPHIAQLYAGLNISILIEYMISESPDSIDQAQLYLHEAIDELRVHSVFEDSYFRKGEDNLQAKLSEELLPVMCYEHEQGHATSSTSGERLRQKIYDIVPSLYQQIDSLVISSGGKFKGNIESIYEFVDHRSRKYNEYIASVASALQGLSVDSILLEVVADFHMIEAVYSKFISLVELRKPSWRSNGHDVYIMSGIMHYIEINNLISGCFVREDLRLGKGDPAEFVQREALQYFEKNTRLVMARFFILDLVRQRRTAFSSGMHFLFRPVTTYNYQAFMDEFSISEANRTAILRALNATFNDRLEKLILMKPTAKLSEMERSEVIETVIRRSTMSSF